VGRGLPGVQLVISDAHAGLKQAIREVFVGAAWQRCRMHFLRNLLAQATKFAAAMVAATMRTICQQPDRVSAQRPMQEGCKTLQARFPHTVALLEEAGEEVCTFYDVPAEHWRQIYNTNPLEMASSQLTISA
jgi:putative transposase